MFSSFPGLTKGREVCQEMAHEQVLRAVWELMAQNRPPIAFECGDGKGEEEEVISLCVRVAFLPHHNPFQILLLIHEYIVC